MIAPTERPKAAPQRPSQTAAATWKPPATLGGFHTRIGTSIVEEFVAGHDLRELVQNEFDAGGSRASVRQTDAECHGWQPGLESRSGRPI